MIQHVIMRRRAARAARALASPEAAAAADKAARSAARAAKASAAKAAIAGSKFSLIAGSDSEDDEDNEEEDGAAPVKSAAATTKADAEPEAEEEDAEDEDEDDEDNTNDADLDDDDAAADGDYDESDMVHAEAEVDVELASEAAALRALIKARRANTNTTAHAHKATESATVVPAAAAAATVRDPLQVANQQELTDYLKSRAHTGYVAEGHRRTVAVQRRLAGLPETVVSEAEDQAHLDAAAALASDELALADSIALGKYAHEDDENDHLFNQSNNTGNEDGGEDSSIVDASSNEHAIRRRVRGIVMRANAVRATRAVPKVTIGMLGFPNVGKSSTINALLGAKKVSVASTPGKTKHFQTLNLGDDIMLCDCPGLVFPTFVHSRSTLIINGVIPVDTLRDFISPMEAVCQRISRSQVTQLYGLDLPAWKPLDAHTLLQGYCRVRGFFRSHGQPDEVRAARKMLKDFNNGELLHCQCPPGLTKEQRRAFYSSFAEEAAAALAAEAVAASQERELQRAEAGYNIPMNRPKPAAGHGSSSSLAITAESTRADIARIRELRALALQTQTNGARGGNANAKAAAAVREADHELAFETETEAMLAQARRAAAAAAAATKAGGNASDASAAAAAAAAGAVPTLDDAGNELDVIDVLVSRAKITAVAPSDGVKVAANAVDKVQNKKNRLLALEGAAMSKKQIYRMRNNMLKGQGRGRDLFEDDVNMVGTGGGQAAKHLNKAYDQYGNRLKVKDMEN